MLVHILWITHNCWVNQSVERTLFKTFSVMIWKANKFTSIFEYLTVPLLIMFCLARLQVAYVNSPAPFWRSWQVRRMLSKQLIPSCISETNSSRKLRKRKCAIYIHINMSLKIEKNETNIYWKRYILPDTFIRF